MKDTTFHSAITGRIDHRANALNLVIPLRFLGPTFLKGWFWWLGLARERHRLELLDRLRFIYAIRWTLLPPFAERGKGESLRREHRWHLLFESNFDGDWDEYLEAFGAIAGGQLHKILWVCLGYPGLDTVSLFKDWAKVNDVAPEHYASAYRSVTAIDIREELARMPGQPNARDALKLGFGRIHPHWSTFVIPLRPGTSTQVRLAARALDVDSDPTSLLLRGEGDVHFVRLSVLDQRSGSHLILTLVHDRPDPRPVLGRMLARDDSPDGVAAGRPLHRVLACADGAPRPAVAARPDGAPEHKAGSWSDDDLLDLVMAHQPASVRHTLKYSAFPGHTADELRQLAGEPGRHETWPAGVEAT